MNENMKTFEDLDLGSQHPITVPMATVEVEVNPEVLVDDYAIAFCREAYRVNPNRANQVNLSEQEVKDYFRFILMNRILYVQDRCQIWRKMKRLPIPVFLQYAIRQIGQVVVREQGITLTPVANFEVITLEEAFVIGDKISAFENDLQIVFDAFPRDFTGNESVMGTALIAGYVRSIRKVDHVSDTYITAFLGMKLREEQAFQVIYRQQYDDLEFIYTALTNDRRIFT